ncbi:MAG: tRNA preQ1(34) S-adenosylmethionine ribosyltransferase-isomerase QueA [Gammaproteobacteria bacterium]|nr:tRNA preQ1(34) S-adenosylmethionine ribosyltransferase-isomerase QueA [Gammaproteobacteria bacterium]
MLRQDFHYELPEELIAQYPLERRSASRLLCLDPVTGAVCDRQFTLLPALLRAGDLLVFNDTRVIPARLFGHKASGGRVEVFVERLCGDRELLCQLRASKPPRPGMRLTLEGAVEAEVVGRDGGFIRLRLVEGGDVAQLLEQHGHVPLPPYIARGDQPQDRERYQTMFARTAGAVAAPTAGLHFDQPLIERLAQRGISSGFVTLHVGAGTFQPVRVDDLSQHRMHREYLQVDAQLCDQVRQTRQRGGRIIAVGTTAVRCLETAASGGELHPYSGETELFITPGYRFRMVDMLITNFHMPESTLLMLVCAFGGMEQVMQAYRHAVMQRYRFFSYGDAMMIGPATGAAV